MEALAELLGESPAMTVVRDRLHKVLESQAAGRRLPTLLIQGETGTGKGLVARLVHRLGPRRGGPFVDINCPAIPETLLEAELFGFERGAFTDARHAKPGLFQTAHRGTLFLDEVGLLPASVQAKLLTVVEERVVRRLGSTRPEPVDAGSSVPRIPTSERPSVPAGSGRTSTIGWRSSRSTFPHCENGGATCFSSPIAFWLALASTMGCR